MLKGSKEELLRLRKELERKNQKIEILESELGKMNNFAELLKDLVIMTDEKGVISQTSHALFSNLGYHHQDLLGKNILELIHPDDKLAFKLLFRKAHNKEPSTLLHRVRKKSKKYIWIETNCRKNEKYGPDIIFYIRNLSDKMRFQADILLSNQHYKSLLEHLPFVLFRYNEELKHIYVSPNVKEILPFEPEEILGSRFRELGFDKEKVAFFETSVKEVFDTGKKIEKEFEQESQRGLLSLNWKLIPEYNQNNKLVSVLGILEDKTEMKEIQKEQKRSEVKFRTIFDTIPDAVVLSQLKDGKLIEVNEGFLKLTGYKEKEVLNNTSVGIGLFPDKKTRDEFSAKVEKGPLLNHELLFLNKNREEINVLLSASLLKLNGSDLLISVFRDISSLKKDQKKLDETIDQLRETDEKFNSFFENSPDGILIADKDGTILDWNKSMTAFTGVSSEEAIGKEWDILIEDIHANQSEKRNIFSEIKSNIRKFVSSQKKRASIKFEADLFNRNGELLKLENIIFRFHVGEMIRYGLISRDITLEKKNRDKALLYREIFLNNEDGVAILDNNGRYREINRAYKNIIGYGIKDLKAKDSSILLGKKIHSEVFKVYEFQNIFEGELKATTADHKNIYLDLVLFPVTTEHESFIVQIIRDISEKKEIETNLIRARHKAEYADRLKTDFLSNMSHEIRTPMNSILGFANLLQGEDLSDQQRGKYVEFINKNGENLLNLIGDIIDISKMESNQLRMIKAPCNLNYLVNELRESLGKVMRREGKEHIELRLSCDSSEEVTIFTDCYRVRQILVNLIYNSIKFTEQGYIDFGYIINNEREVIFHVKDTGIGIPEDMQEKIFERFQKSERAGKKTYTGAGLGLTISSQLVNLLGGKIWLESYQDQGTSFFFSLPYIKAQEKLEQKLIVEQDSLQADWSSRKIMIVEDDVFNTELLIQFLSGTNVKIISAENGKKATALFSMNPDTNLIIMDIRLPEMDGIEATKLIRELNPGITVVALTAFARQEDRDLAKAAGFNEYLVKPIQKEVFLRTLSKYLSADSAS